MRAEARRALSELYAEVEAEVARHRPRCEMSGRCCDFEAHGHELWSSALETAYARDAAGGVVPEAPSSRCPWHVDGLCRLRDGRPLGCRLYFCDPAWTDTMPAIYERFHARLVALHAEHGVPYGYERFVESVRRVVAPDAGDAR
ncbi:MAG: hypothetical protein H6825_15540 [Planctomycetes bacterium]|nr:hypothetical protein [Planctomycetota bacterium]